MEIRLIKCKRPGEEVNATLVYKILELVKLTGVGKL